MDWKKDKKIQKALAESKKLQEKQDKYTVSKLKKQDHWFIEQAKKLSKLLSKFPKNNK